MPTQTIDGRFNGPPDSANGGYSCGLLACFLDGPAEVTLRAPPPLDRELEVRRERGEVTLLDGEAVVAEARPTDPLELELPEPPSVEEAEAASARYLGFEQHNFPTCFVCGPERPASDGLEIHCGQLGETPDVGAAPWTPRANLPADDGAIRPEIVWAALDCPGVNPRMLRGIIDGRRAVVLGRLAARILAPVRIGEPHVAIGWAIGREGRKHLAGSALFSAGGQAVAFARATWIEIARPGG